MEKGNNTNFQKFLRSSSGKSGKYTKYKVIW